MKFQKIVLFYGITLPASIVMRLLQLTFTVDMETGFYRQEYRSLGGILLLLIAAACAATAIFSFTAHRNPEHPPKGNLPLSAAAAAFAVSIFYEIGNEHLAATVQGWQSALLLLTGFLAAIYFLAYAAAPWISALRLPASAAVLPSAYLIMRLICTFSAVSALAFISDHLLVIAAYCVALLFIICFGKLYNGLDTERNFRRLLAAGLCGSVLCFTQSVPHLTVNLLTNRVYLHTSLADSVSIFLLGVFITVFTFSHFSAQKTDPQPVSLHGKHSEANGEEHP